MKKLALIILALFLIKANNFAQEADSSATVDEKVANLEGRVDGVNDLLLETRGFVDALNKIKVGGYIQEQFQSGQIDGPSAVGNYQGGAFASGMHNRFLLRRAELKTVYDNGFAQGVFNINLGDNAAVTVKDAYLAFKEPWLQTFELWGGIFNRPFGFEIEYSSSNIETLERSRMFQTLFPGERDEGVKLEVKPTSGVLSYFNLKAGLFNGNGVNPETDNNKDFIGRLGFSFPFTEANLAIDGGISTYLGKVRLSPSPVAASTSYTVTGTYDTLVSGGVTHLIPKLKATTTAASYYKLYMPNSSTAAIVDSTTLDVDRKYYGFDLQIYYDIPVIGGFTLRGEYITGKQPGTTSAQGNSYTAAPTGDIYLRNFMGYYITYVQNLGLVDQLVFRYDVFDPNTDVSGDQIGLNSKAKLGAADIKYSTIGFGLIHYWDSNVRIALYYDMPKNETSVNLKGYTSDIKDNVLTFRLQYKF